MCESPCHHFTGNFPTPLRELRIRAANFNDLEFEYYLQFVYISEGFIMKVTFFTLLADAAAAASGLRYVMYYDQ